MNRNIKLDYFCKKHKIITKCLLNSKERPFCEECIKEECDKNQKAIHINCIDKEIVKDEIEKIIKLYGKATINNMDTLPSRYFVRDLNLLLTQLGLEDKEERE